MDQIQFKYNSTVGNLYLTASASGLTGVHWKKQSLPMTKNFDSKEATHKILKSATKQLDQYFAGTRKEFDLPLDFAGTTFQESVWKALRSIPYGKTISYKELAKKIRNEKAVRAVGTANGKNPLSIIIPCHRVIAADGSLGGYASGLKNKERLLQLEVPTA